MTNPTSNYSFQMPTATDLVTDLPADFEVFGQAVDTRLKALQPGTTLGDLAYSSATANTNTRLPIGTSGQVLAVSGGGVPAWTTTADVTPLTTKGDLFTFTTVDARIGVGANNTVLTADSAEATGLKWAAPSSSTPVFSLVTNGTITSGTELSITGLSSYDQLQIAFTGANCGTSGSQLNVRFNSSTASTYYTLGGMLEIQNSGSTFTSCTVAPSISSSGNAFRTPRGYLSPGTQNSLVLDLKGCKSASGFTTGTVTGFFESYVQVGEQFYQYVFGQATAATLSSVQFFWEDGYAFTGGTYRVYGA